MIFQNVLRTKSGLFVREDAGFGLFIYSPYLGLVFACVEEDSERVLMWLEQRCDKAPSAKYEKALGPGWLIPLKDVEYPIPPYLLPDAEAWPILPKPNRPILINWLLTGNCPLSCQYCYAEDLMRGNCPEPNGKEIEQIAEAILSFKPLAVVLTGGDPLFSPHLEKAITLLHKRTGIIIDTSAYTFNSNHLKIFQQYNVFVRVSIDSERPSTNDNLRPVSKAYRKSEKCHSSTVDAAINALTQCIDKKVCIAVQTVATTLNSSDLISFGDKLVRLGVSGWRILMVAPSKERYQAYQKLIGPKQRRKRFIEFIQKELLSRREWNRRMAVQITHNKTANEVILVSPDGIFRTESNVESGGKVVLDEQHPKLPRLNKILKNVDMHAHVARYLNFVKKS